MIKPLFLVLALITALSLSQPTTQPCQYRCEDCESDGACKTCLKSIPEGNRCAPAKNLQKCLIIYLTGKCEICEAGYSLVSSTPLSQTQSVSSLQDSAVCQPSTIQNCQVGLGSKKSPIGHETCYACKGGFPTQDRTKCVPFNGENAAKNCLWGTRSPSGKYKQCFRCELGYAASSDFGGCFQTLTNLYGCLSSSEQTCQVCNFYEGFSMDKKGDCKHLGA